MTPARFIVPFVVLAGGLSAGCSSMSNTGKGAVGGSLIGSAIGTGIGIAAGDPLAGAAIGGLAGAGVGGAVGNEQDSKERERSDAIALAQAAQPVSRGPLSVGEVIQMSRPDAGGKPVSDAVILDYIRSTGSQYNLSPTDIRDLSANGVSDRVIQEMMATRNPPPAGPRTVVVREPAPPPVVYVDRPYYDPYGPWGGPPVYVRPYHYRPRPAVGFSYTHIRR